jgi:uncharacterized membrane protein
MFEFLFSYPRSVFSKGELVLLGQWPVWLLGLLILAGAALLAWRVFSRRGDLAEGVRGWRVWAVWGLQAAMLALVLVLLWQPAVVISSLKPQQNIVAVVVDDSGSMSINESGQTRRDQAVKALNNGVLTSLGKKFQTRLYRMSDVLARVNTLDEIQGKSPYTRIGDSLKQVAAEAGGLPIGAVLLVTDGADNSGGIDLETIAELRSRRIPVHPVGVGREKPQRDIEIADAQMAARALADSRLGVTVTFQQYGYTGQKGKLTLRDGGKVLAARDVTFAGEGKLQTETLLFNAGVAGAKALDVALNVQDGEENQKNNATSRLLNVESDKPRVLYIEGEPRWEYKFIRRALEDDRSVQIASMLRTTQNKIYRQGIDEKGKELEHGFPATVEELFRYQGIVLGTVELGYFTPTQQELIKQFVDRRGGGLLFLGGRASLSDGGYTHSALTDLIPVMLPDRKGTFHRDPAKAELAPAGMESLICRLAEDPGKNAETWKQMPQMADYQEVGGLKAGAVVLAESNVNGKRSPLLAIQNYGRGRTAVLATGGTWRWQMVAPLEDKTHEMFWQQLLRWLVQDTPGQVVASTPRPMLFDDGRVRLNADVRDKNYLPMQDAVVEARIMGPDGIAAMVEMTPDSVTPGLYTADWTAEKPGSYITEVLARRGTEDVGRHVMTFQRQDGVAENFRTNQNRDLLEKLATQTGGRYWKPDELDKLNDEIAYSEAGITVRETKDLWSMPAILLALLLMRATEWLLRRKWGVV